MRIAVKEDREKVVRIVQEAFEQNPSVLFVVKQDAKIKQRIRVLAEYSFDYAFLRDGVFLSDDELGVAICYLHNKRKEGFKEYLLQLKLIRKCIGWNRVLKVLKRESILKKNRPIDGNFIYFWLLGISNARTDNSTVIDLRNGVFKHSLELKLPIYLETSVPKNYRVYQRFGFESYAEWTMPETGRVLYFMRREK